MTIEFDLNDSGIYVDYTDSVILKELEIEKSLTPVEYEQQLDLTGKITATAESYTFLKTNLIDSANRYSNFVYVRITITDCGKVYSFKIGNDNLAWCDSESCIMDFDLIEQDDIRNCIDNTLIADNTPNSLGVFDGSDTLPLPHPRFRYCDVTRPYGLLVALLLITQSLDLILLPLNFVIAIFGGNKFASFAKWLVNCRRVHPAPFIRTYTDNVCEVCTNTGSPLTSDSSTNPIFYDVASQYYNLTFMTAFVSKGYKADKDSHYRANNAPFWTIRKLYKEMSKVFNGRYFIHNNKIYFDRKDLIGTTIWGATPVVDLTGSDGDNLLESVCYAYNGEKKNSRIYLSYTSDGTDNEGDLAQSRFNGEETDFSSENYRNYEERKFEEFGAQIYTYDGIDSVYDSSIHSGAIFSGGADYFGALKMSSDIARLGKLIIWDGVSSYSASEAIGAQYSNFDTSQWDDDDGTTWYPPPTIIGLWSSALNNASFQVKNYPMFTSPEQNAIYPNLWEFHKIDMPDPAKKTNIQFNFALNLCCAYLDLDMYQKVQLNSTDVGEVTNVKFDFSAMNILVKGNLIN